MVVAVVCNVGTMHAGKVPGSAWSVAKTREFVDLPQFMYSNTVFTDEMVVFRNFGTLVNYPNPGPISDDLYLAQVQGLWTALWQGGTLANVELGINILFGFPFMTPGKVESIQTNSDGSFTVFVSDTFGENRPIEVPALLAPVTVTAGQIVTRFTPLGTGIRAVDYIDDLDFMIEVSGEGAFVLPQIFFIMVVRIEPEAFEAALDIFGDDFATTTIPLVQTFMENIKPEYVDFLLNPRTPFEEEFTLDDGDPDDFDRFIFRNITSTILENYVNVLSSDGLPLDDDTIALHDELEILIMDGTETTVIIA